MAYPFGIQTTQKTVDAPEEDAIFDCTVLIVPALSRTAPVGLGSGNKILTAKRYLGAG